MDYTRLSEKTRDGDLLTAQTMNLVDIRLTAIPAILAATRAEAVIVAEETVGAVAATDCS